MKNFVNKRLNKPVFLQFILRLEKIANAAKKDSSFTLTFKRCEWCHLKT